MGWKVCTLSEASRVEKMIPAGVENLPEGSDPGWKTDRKKLCVCVCFIYMFMFLPVMLKRNLENNSAVSATLCVWLVTLYCTLINCYRGIVYGLYKTTMF